MVDELSRICQKHHLLEQQLLRMKQKQDEYKAQMIKLQQRSKYLEKEFGIKVSGSGFDDVEDQSTPSKSAKGQGRRPAGRR